MKYLLTVLLLLGSVVVSADDIDIFFGDIAQQGSPLQVIFAVDVPGAQRNGHLNEVAESMAEALSILAARQLARGGAGAMAVALLEPGDADGSWQLGEFTDLGGALVPGMVSESLLAMAEQDLPPLRLSEIYQAVNSGLSQPGSDLPACAQFLLINLLFDIPPDVEGGTFATPEPTAGVALRSRYIAPVSLPLLGELALSAGSALSVAFPGVAMTQAITSTISQVRAGTATLLSATVPQGRASGSSDVFIPLFEPRPHLPWAGNLKKLQMVRDSSGGFQLVQAGSGATPLSAIDEEDGGIRVDALTFWTDPQGADVQSFDPVRNEVRGRDGRSVTRGGAGQRIPGFLAGGVGLDNSEPGARRVFVLPVAPAEPLLPVSGSAPLLPQLGLLLDPDQVFTDQQRLSLAHFVRGLDAFDEDLDGDVLENRNWLLGAVLHSQPLLLNYGRQGGASAPDERLVFGSNDGALHMLRNNTTGLSAAGEESWTILPREMMSLQATHVGLKVPGAGFTYGVDGTAVASIRDLDADGVIEAADGDKVRIFFSMRRGGSNHYALDVSEPDQPKLLWQISAGQAGFEQLALGFSTPRVISLDLGESTPREALLFAGGYNGGWQGGRRLGKDGAGGQDTIGNAIYLVDASTGALIWQATGPGAASAEGPVSFAQPLMKHSIAAPVAPVDSDGNGIVDRAYVADTGGSLWRIDLAEAGDNYQGSLEELLGGWAVRRIASLGGEGVADRRFFHQADYVRSRDDQGDYDGIILTSGDRARPAERVVENYAYMIKDRGGAAVTHEQLTEITQVCREAGSASCQDSELSKGWKLALTVTGEKGLSRPLVSRGQVYFSTFIPATVEPESCASTPGGGRLYAVHLANGAPALRHRVKSEEDSDPVPPPDSQDQPVRSAEVGPGIPGPVMPWRDLLMLPGTGLNGSKLIDPGGPSRWRIFWREEGVDVQ